MLPRMLRSASSSCGRSGSGIGALLSCEVLGSSLRLVGLVGLPNAFGLVRSHRVGWLRPRLACPVEGLRCESIEEDCERSDGVAVLPDQVVLVILEEERDCALRNADD